MTTAVTDVVYTYDRSWSHTSCLRYSEYLLNPRGRRCSSPDESGSMERVSCWRERNTLPTLSKDSLTSGLNRMLLTFAAFPAELKSAAKKGRSRAHSVCCWRVSLMNIPNCGWRTAKWQKGWITSPLSLGSYRHSPLQVRAWLTAKPTPFGWRFNIPTAIQTMLSKTRQQNPNTIQTKATLDQEANQCPATAKTT